ncbi:MAG TPA: hypothetical protein VFG69_02255, partial [Nannocystaceae bacterium]|nr:hypothetical protein [Nannocystaceae bacterium]
MPFPRRASSLVLALALGCSGSSTPPPQRGSGEPGKGREIDREGRGPTIVDSDLVEPATAAPSLDDAKEGLAPERAALVDTAAAIVDDIRELEVARDVTCWTSFRQLENFIATKTYSNFAALTKIVAAKALVHGVWIAASERASAAELGKAEITAIFDPEAPAASVQPARAAPIDLGAQQFEDYRTTSEHLRIVLSIAQDELARRDPRVKPLSDEG